MISLRKVIKDAHNRSKAVGSPQPGVVLHDVDVSGGDYYYYNRYYHSYYCQAEAYLSFFLPH
ncbi:MAG: hypothetical protein GYA55_03385 [SAR324 cluster bacterium]|uniref:Uncharacterized protein n=1 Tax=SAR324 cluster bacterium TaxID=2024889 RepID=A0A7X9IIL8_9DELT|nr:hypothetical protein [SAR324 cluster bacterium]